MGVKIKTTFGRRVCNLASNLGLSRVVVENVIKAYIDSLVEDATNGEDIVIDGCVSIKIMQDENGNLTPRGRVSEALKQKIANKTDNTDQH